MRSLRIIVPVLNEGPRLGAFLDALKPLRGRGAEVVVVDGGSTDETWAVAAANADRVLLAPRGRGAQMNAGAAGAGADALLFLHADTALPPRADLQVAEALAGGRSWGRFDLRIAAAHPLLRLVGRLVNLRSRITGIATGDQAIFVQRRAFEQLGGFADLPLMEDVEFTGRLRRLGPPACIDTPVVTSARRWLERGIIRTIMLMWRLRLQYFFGADPHRLAQRYGYAPRLPFADAAVAILAKAPVAGVAKTRLGPSLGARQAARAQRCFTAATVSAVGEARLGPVTLWCAPDASHRFFRAVHGRTGIPLLAQPAGDLGERMRHAAMHHFAGHPGLPLLLIGTDCPALGPGHLQEAARALARHDAVLVPAEDGGYVLLGLRRPIPQVFEGIAWSTAAVAAQTRARLREAGATWHELPPLWDVDEPADWERLQHLLNGLAKEPDGLEPAR